MMNTSTLKFFISKYKECKRFYSSISYLFNEEQIKAPDKCVDKVMNFARAYRAEKSKTTGYVEMIMN